MSIKVGILCVPDRDDDAILAVRRLLQSVHAGIYVLEEASVDSQRHWIEDVLRRWCDEEELDCVVTIGGTFPAPGPSAKEIVPEATAAVIERPLPGLPEAMRAHARPIAELALLDRGVCGIRSRTLILNLPAGAAPAHLFLEAIVHLIPHTIAHLHESPTAQQLTDILELTESDAAQAVRETPPSASPAKSSAHTHAPGRRALDPAEFAAFLRRQSQNPDEKSATDS